MQDEQWLKLHPNAKIALIIKPAIGSIFFLILGLTPFLQLVLMDDFSFSMFLFLLVIFFILVFSIIIVWAFMFYNRYMFRIGEDAVFINRGILWKRNVVIPFEKIQHTSVTRGPIDLLLGLHILNLFTAGTGSVGARFGGSAAAFAAEGSIPGLADPKPFQDEIMARVKALKGDGLGAFVPSQTRQLGTAIPIPGSSDSGETQHEMLTELRKIREIIEKKN